MIKLDVMKTAINQMVSRITTQFNPEKIILFGSYSRGTAGPDSDADLLVIMPVQDNRRHQATEIDKALLGIDLPADIIVASPADVRKARNKKESIMSEALREGQVLYERE